MGAKGATINAQLERASRLQAGTRFSQARLDQAVEQMRQALADNGFRQPTITHELTMRPGEQLVDIAFKVVSGPQARIGAVQVSGEPGMSLEEFRRRAHLRSGAHVDHDTVNRALSGVLKLYQKQERLEAEIKLASQTCTADARRCDYTFTATRGPVVRIRVTGAGIGSDRLKRAIPVYEEGTVDEDLLNEGDRRLRDYFQRLGYVDVKVRHERQTPAPDEIVILYTIDSGAKRRVDSVSVAGNRYFDAATLKDLLSVHPANTLDRHGIYSQALVAADVDALQAVYQNNGFSAVKVTPKTSLNPAPISAPGRAGREPNRLASCCGVSGRGRTAAESRGRHPGRQRARRGSHAARVDEYRGWAIAFAAKPCRRPRYALLTHYLSLGVRPGARGCGRTAAGRRGGYSRCHLPYC